ncbi:MAG TPA: hypothetical protein VMV10_06880 [Pirellulales bacterium]|nr:hypothetical protein [Pirellulales bacterium]
MPGRLTPNEEIDRQLAELDAAKSRFARHSLAERIQLAESCLEGTFRLANEWLAAGCEAKGIAVDSPLAGEELATGPLATTRFLQLLIRSLKEIDAHGRPQLPGKVDEDVDGRLRVQVFPARGMYDEWLFRGFRADVWMQPGVNRENLDDALAPDFAQRLRTERIALVLGAGNVSSIPAVDAFGKLFAEGRVVLLKMNPVNEYLGAIFERAYARVIEAGFLRLIYGGAETGAYAVAHPLVDEVHITGSITSHDVIVWGPPGEEREARRAAGRPLLTKPITSELGNVTPWIVVPGPYRRRELDFQAENVAAMIVNNASFNCIACKLIVSWRGWPDRQKFLDKIESVLARTPRRRAYYPGAVDRFRRFTGREPEQSPPGTLPWTLVRDIDPDREPRWLEEESFVCAGAETALEATDPAEFLDRAVDFVNERVWGALGAGLMIHPASRKGAENEARFRRAVARLRYGTVAINHWPAIAYAIMNTPWGGSPGGTLADPQSGIGWVHNTYLLDRIEKSVFEGPLVVRSKPFWFPSHRQADKLAWKVMQLYHQPDWRKLPGIFWSALRG